MNVFKHPILSNTNDAFLKPNGYIEMLQPTPCKSTKKVRYNYIIITMLETAPQHNSNFHTHPHTTGTPSSPPLPLPNSSLVHVSLTIAFMSTW